VPMELASLAGTLGGISQIAAGALQQTAAGEAALGAPRTIGSALDASAPSGRAGAERPSEGG